MKHIQTLYEAWSHSREVDRFIVRHLTKDRQWAQIKGSKSDGKCCTSMVVLQSETKTKRSFIHTLAGAKRNLAFWALTLLITLRPSITLPSLCASRWDSAASCERALALHRPQPSPAAAPHCLGEFGDRDDESLMPSRSPGRHHVFP